MKKMVAVLLALTMVLSIVGCGTTSQPVANAAYTAGTYTASAKGNNGDVTVSVEFTEDAIKSVDVTKHNETKGICDDAIEKIPAAIVEKQALSVDAISGATNTSKAILAAVEDCVAQAGGDVEALKSVDCSEENTDPALTDTDTDVLIIGAGGAGLSAAVSASENGAQVIVIEKLGNVGGNTKICGGAFNTADPERQKNVPMTDALATTVEKLLAHEDVSEAHAKLKAKVQKQWDEYKASGRTDLFDSPEWHALQSLDSGDYDGNVELMENMTTHTLDTLHWLSDNGVVWKDTVNTVIGAMWNRSHQTPNGSGADIVAALQNKAIENGAKIYLNTKADSLIVENGSVVGAKITNAKGEEVTVRANKGVIMATGGFSANVEMRQKYNKQWEDLGESIATNNCPGATGDGIVMGEDVGANLVGMGWIQLMPLYPVSGGGVSGYVNSVLYCNKEGKRYVAEDQRRDVLAAAALEQTDKIFFNVCDAKEAELRGVPQEALDMMTEGGLLFKGDTLAELAENMGVPADAFEQTVASFNEAVEKGEPDEFGRTTWENKIETAPFYASSFTPAVHHTMGGLEINVNAEVINKDGNVIPGLYAAGEVTGGLHGTNRVGGNAVPDALYFGKVAGANAAKN